MAFYYKLLTPRTLLQYLKPLILIVSFITFILLIVATVSSSSNALKRHEIIDRYNDDNNDADEFRRSGRVVIKNEGILGGVLNELNEVTYNDDIIESHVKQLGIKNYRKYNDVDYQSGIVNCSDKRIITSFSGYTLSDHLWEYLNLISIYEKNRLKWRPETQSMVYLTDKSINELLKVFKR